MASELSNVASAEIVRESPSKVVWLLAWPIVALNSLQVINTLLDRGFIGHLRDADLTAHGGATNVMFLYFSLAIAIATGVTAVVSRAYGAGSVSEYRLTSRQSFRIGLYFGIGFAVLAYLTAEPVARLILPADNTAAIAGMAAFVRNFAIGLPAITLIQVLAGCLRGIGDTKSPMYISSLQIFFHILFNFIFIFPPRGIIPGLNLGLPGAALALSLSCTICAIAYVVYTGRTPLGQVFSLLPPSLSWTKRILRIAVPTAFMSTLRVLSITTITIILSASSNGSNAIAGMTTAFAIESIMIMPAFGLAAASGTLVGQSLGMKREDRAETLAWTSAFFGVLLTLALVIPIWYFAPFIAGVLTGGKLEIVTPASQLLRDLCVTEPFFSFAMVMVGSFQGAGETKSPIWISVIGLWLIRVPMCLVMTLATGSVLTSLFGFKLHLLFGYGMGENGSWLGIAFTQMVQGVIAFFLFRAGRWKTTQV